MLVETVLTILLCLTYFITSNFGVYLLYKANTDRILRLPFFIFLGYYFITNYFRPFILIPTIFGEFLYLSKINSYYNYFAIIAQELLLTSMSVCCIIATFKNEPWRKSAIKSSNLTVLVFVVFLCLHGIGFYFPILRLFATILNVVIIFSIVITFILSIGVMGYLCCVYNIEKRASMKLVIIPFFIGFIFIIKCIMILVTGVQSWYRGYNALMRSVDTIGMLCEIITLLGSFALFFVLRPKKIIRHEVPYPHDNNQTQPPRWTPPSTVVPTAPEESLA